ncbi:7SK snRNA methylphosphate capping enzyme [Alternaria panax]|uniref:RNA methyltransferase n=1 Tax=Alternaria panax TaxID=48097 RepID=A0AAD4FI91_9PLEO|nr:7SK snRNA methylphosphate capping enzyme [Alternaria panax]
MATQFGNYMDYSGVSRLPASATHLLDPRLDILATLIPGIFAAKHCLDVGCNAGSVSIQLSFDFHAASVTGVDIDPKLIAQAEKLLALRASRASPPTTGSAPVVDYFPISAVLTHGYRIEPQNKAARTPSTASAAWSHVTFFSADWAVPSSQDMEPSYDVILALSVIKWIHLEHRDTGLVAFFGKCSSSLRTGGYLVIELQAWDSYQKAVRPNHSPHFHETLKELELRPDTSFDHLLANHGLQLCASSDALPRRINVYRKI